MKYEGLRLQYNFKTTNPRVYNCACGLEGSLLKPTLVRRYRYLTKRVHCGRHGQERTGWYLLPWLHHAESSNWGHSSHVIAWVRRDRPRAQRDVGGADDASFILNFMRASTAGKCGIANQRLLYPGALSHKASLP